MSRSLIGQHHNSKSYECNYKIHTFANGSPAIESQSCYLINFVKNMPSIVLECVRYSVYCITAAIKSRTRKCAVLKPVITWSTLLAVDRLFGVHVRVVDGACRSDPEPRTRLAFAMADNGQHARVVRGGRVKTV